MKFTGAYIVEQGVSFAIALVKTSATSSPNSTQTKEVMAGFQPFFPNVPIVLASQNSKGEFKYVGRSDLVKFLANIDPSRIPWKEYTTR